VISANAGDSSGDSLHNCDHRERRLEGVIGGIEDSDNRPDHTKNIDGEISEISTVHKLSFPKWHSSESRARNPSACALICRTREGFQVASAGNLPISIKKGKVNKALSNFLSSGGALIPYWKD